MENSLLFNFHEIWPETMYYSTGTFANFDWNQLKLSMQHKNMYMYQIKL